MKKYLLLLLFVNAFLLESCTNTSSEVMNTADINYLELLKKDIAFLNQIGADLNKTIIYSGKKESKNLNAPNWDKELMPFINCDIQKPGFEKLYTISNRVSGDSTIILYSANSPSLQIRNLEIVLLHNTLNLVIADVHKKNTYFELNEQLIYSSRKGYIIKGSQKMMFASETIYQVEAECVSIK